MIAPDDHSVEYLAGRPFAPKGKDWDRALSYWRSLPSDDGAAYITGGELAVTLRGMLATAVALVLSLLAAGMGFLAFALLFFPYHYAGQLPKSGDVEAAILLLIGGCVGGALAYLIKRKG